VREALEQRSENLIEEGLAKRHGQRVIFARNLIDTLRDRDLAEASKTLASRHGGLAQATSPGDHVAGTYRERVTLASGRFAMIDNGMGFQLVPWRQDLEHHLGQTVTRQDQPARWCRLELCPVAWSGNLKRHVNDPNLDKSTI
jgi:hypothetical protein